MAGTRFAMTDGNAVSISGCEQQGFSVTCERVSTGTHLGCAREGDVASRLSRAPRCGSLIPDLFSRRAHRARAEQVAGKAVCATWPVQRTCLEYALVSKRTSHLRSAPPKSRGRSETGLSAPRLSARALLRAFQRDAHPARVPFRPSGRRTRRTSRQFRGDERLTICRPNRRGQWQSPP